jgi:hypothetical protein
MRVVSVVKLELSSLYQAQVAESPYNSLHSKSTEPPSVIVCDVLSGLYRNGATRKLFLKLNFKIYNKFISTKSYFAF